MNDYLIHHGIQGQKWGVRKYQNEDGSLTAEGKERYSKIERSGYSKLKSARLHTKNLNKMSKNVANYKTSAYESERIGEKMAAKARSLKTKLNQATDDKKRAKLQIKYDKAKQKMDDAAKNKEAYDKMAKDGQQAIKSLISKLKKNNFGIREKEVAFNTTSAAVEVHAGANFAKTLALYSLFGDRAYGSYEVGSRYKVKLNKGYKAEFDNG